MRKKIFIVDDYEESCLTLSEIFSSEYETQYTSKSLEALARIEAFGPDLVILDYKMPDLGGLELCALLRQKKNLKELPIVFISGAASIDEKIQAFEQGASDFVVKPYNVKELLLRVKARLNDIPTSGAQTTLAAGNLKINLISREVRVGEEDVELTVKQFEILKLLVESEGSIVTRNQFLSDVWDGVEVNSRNVDSQINYLKKKIQNFDGRIYSVAGQGYVLEKNDRG